MPESEPFGCARIIWLVIASTPRLARHLFAARDVFGVEDEQLRHLGMARSILGFIVTVIVGYIYRKNGEALLHVIKSRLISQNSSSEFSVYLYGGICLIIGLSILAYWQRDGRRRHLLTPLYAYLWALVVLFGPPAVFSIVYHLHLHIQQRLDGGNGGWLFLGFVLFLFFLLWWGTFLAICLFYLARDSFRAADAHPLLAPALSTTIPLVAFLASGFQGSAGVPGWTETIMSASGVVTTGILSAIEIYRLRHNHGITVKSRAGVRAPAKSFSSS